MRDETSVLARAFGRVNLPRRLYHRVLLSCAKHGLLLGHPRMALRVSRWVRTYSYPEAVAFSRDFAPPEVVEQRRQGFERLSALFEKRAPATLALGDTIELGLSDLAFINAHRVPFPFQELVQRRLRVGSVVDQTDGPCVRDMDGNWSYDLSGSYGVNLFGTAFYKSCIDRGVERARDLGLVLGAYHPIVADNVERLGRISGLDEVSFHMSGTEAVMQAVRLARYHTRRSHVVRFCGAYHGWWDGVQAGIGNPMPARDVYTLREMDDRSLRVLRTRDDIACVLVNPIQALAPNSGPASDSSLVASDRAAAFNKAAYAGWLGRLRQICTARGIVLIFDEVFLGFRLARGGVQEYFGVRADLVTYGKSVGGGLPVGVLCGTSRFMRRFNADRAMDICFARGTFNAHPYVMATMNEFLRHLDEPDAKAGYDRLEAQWNHRAGALNSRLEECQVPVRVAHMVSVWTTLYTRPGAYNWMFQYYLRAEGLSPGWIGTGRFIFSHDLDDLAFDEITRRFVAAACAMQADGWWWSDAALTNTAIKRRVLAETIRVSLGRASLDRSTAL